VGYRNRIISFDDGTFERLYDLMRKRGYPKRPVSESEIVAEAIGKLHRELCSVKKTKGKEEKEG